MTMNYYILTYQVVIDGKIQDPVRIGVESKSTDYRPNQAKDRIIEEYKRKNPSSKITAVLVGKPELISKENYQPLRSTILEIKAPDQTI